MRDLFKHFLRYISLIIFVLSLNTHHAKADAITDVVKVIMSLTCETEGIGDLLMKPFTHTCIQDPFSTMVVANIISPGLYATLMMKLRLDDDNIFPGNCLRKRRADPNNPTIDFGLCTNYLMIAYRAQMLLEFTGSLATGSPSWDKLANMIDSSKYTQMFRDKHDGDWGIFADIPLYSFPVIPWKVISHGDRICVETLSFIGWMHVGCKYIAEPFPKSVYGSFFSNDVEAGHIPPDLHAYLSCSNAGGCAARAEAHSQAAISVSATIMECIREMLAKLLISKDVCNMDSITPGQNIDRSDSIFFQFQVNMQRTVMALLTLYVMFIGFKILLAGDELPKSSELIMYVLKIILVIYFSVGINMNGNGTRFDGMTELVFPLLMGAASEIAIWVMNATPSGLCKFLPNEYPSGLGYIALWDALDCKVMHYLGVDAIMTIFQGQHSGDPLGNSIPPYVYLILPALYFKQINLVILAISYPLVVMSLAAYLVNSFAVCMIAIAILGILAPIYVPMALFQQTKGYFEGWYTLMISFVLQPVVVIGFMTLMFALYDMGFYGTCKYTPMLLKKTDSQGEIRIKKLFIIDDNKKNYSPDGDYAEYASCQESIGWILNNPLGALAAGIARNSTDGKTIDMSAAPGAEKKLADYISQFGALSGITPVMGFFLGYFTLLSQLSWSMIVNLMTCCLLLYLMYELSAQLGEFASDIAQSVPLSGVISPRGLADKAISGVKKAGEALKKKDDSDSGGGKAPSMRGGGAATPAVSGSSGGGGGGAATPAVAGPRSGGGGGNLSPRSGGATTHAAAVADNNDGMRKLLANSDSNFNTKDASGKTALHIATENNNSEMMREMVASGKVDPNIKDADGKTAMHLAVEHVNNEGVRSLMASDKLDLTLKDDKGRTAIDVAKAHGNEEAVQMLSSYKPSAPASVAQSGNAATPAQGAVAQSGTATTQLTESGSSVPHTPAQVPQQERAGTGSGLKKEGIADANTVHSLKKGEGGRSGAQPTSAAAKPSSDGGGSSGK